MKKKNYFILLFICFIKSYSQNDLCSNAIALTPAIECNLITGTFSGSGISTPAPSCGSNSSQDVWYQFVATDPTMSVYISPANGVNHGFQIIQNNCNGTIVACQNSNTTSTSESYIGNSFVVGETYLIRVFNASANLTTASFEICVRNYPTPINDLCSNAIALTPAIECNLITGTFSGSGISTPAPSCGSNSSQDVWYQFVATDPTMSVYISPANGVNHGFQIIQNNCNGTIVACQNSNTTSTSESYIGNSFVVGETYLIRVFNASANLTTASFEICVRNYPTPINDLCSNAIALTPAIECNLITGTFSGSGISSPAPSCGSNSSQDVWYQFVATDPTMSVYISPANGVNHGFQIIQNNCNGTIVACQNSNTTSTSESYIGNSFVVGETYLIRVFNASANLTTASFEICVRNYPTPINDLCSNAIALTPAIECNLITGTFSGSGISSPAPSCGSNSSQDVWYQFVATDPTMSVYISPANGVNHGFQIIQNNCNGTIVACQNSNTTSTSESYIGNSFVVGETYLIRVFNASANLTTASFEICVRNYPTPINDLCSNAIALTPAIECNLITGTFSGSGISTPAPSCGSNSSQDVWYQFVATDPTMSVYISPANGVNHGFQIIQNNCNGTIVACQNSNTTSTSESYIGNSFVVGETYLIRVFNASANLTTASFEICVRNYPTPINDLCSNAIALTPAIECNLITGTFSGSGISTPAPSCGSNSSQDVWYQFVATDPTMSVYISPANGVNHGFQIIQNNCNGTIVACQNSNTTSTSESYIGNSFVVGETYLIRVFNASANLTTASFEICVQDANLNSNDFTEAVYSIFPNPAQNEITIHSQDDILNITCFDVLGKKIRVFQISDSNSINISDLGSGLYFLKLTFANGKTVTSKLIKN